MSREFSGNRKRGEIEPGRDHLFLWTVGILLLIGVTLAVWLGSFYLFGHPEKPQSYRLLQKLNKLDPPMRYELTKAPNGEFLTAKKAYDRFSTLSASEMRRLNEGLIRDYIRNYENTKRSVPYITGRYTILNCYELKESDFFGEGVVAVAQAVDVPQLVVEHVYTAPRKVIPVLEQMLATGLNIQLERLTDLAAVIHVDRTPDGRIQLTVVPLLYGSYALQQGRGSFSLEPPATLNPAGGLPIIRDQMFTDSVQAYHAFLQKRTGPTEPGGPPRVAVARPVADTTIVRVETPEDAPPSGTTLEPTPEPTPEAAALAHQEEAATPVILPEESPSGQQPALPPVNTAATPRIASATPPPVVPVRTPGPPPPTPTPEPTVAVAAATPLLQPFLAASPTPGAVRPPSNGSWRTYPPGRMPRGRLVTLSEADDLAERGTGGERLYLRGNFVVTATGDNRAVLRSSSRIGNVIESVTQQPGTRVIVEFPAGASIPGERSQVSRDEMRPFEIRDVQRGNDGQINIFVREVTAP